MPYKCCAPGCKSNYAGSLDYVTVYKFPNDASRLDLWMRKIPRENLDVTKSTRICIQHFEERFIIRNYVFRGQDGQMHTEPRDVPILTDDAYPSIFPHLPQYLSDKVTAPRKDPNRWRAEIDERSDAVLAGFLQGDVIKDYTSFTELIQSRIKDHVAASCWSVFSGCNATFLYVFDEQSNVPGLSVCIKVHSDLSVKICVGDLELSDRKLSWILGANCILERCSQL